MVTIDVGNSSEDFESLDFIVDTGFSGELALPHDVIRRLALPYVEQETVTLADEREIQTGIYRGIALWHGRHREVRVIEMDGIPLLGMYLLQGSTLTISSRLGGNVLIEEDQTERL